VRADREDGVSRVLLLGTVCLTLAVVPALAGDEEPAPPVPRDLALVLEALEAKPSKEVRPFVESIPDAMLTRVLDHLMASGGGGWRQRTVSTVLSWRILDRRVARLRVLAPSDEALADAPPFDVLDYPRTDGSTSTIPLERVVASRLLDAPYLWGNPRKLRHMETPFEGPASGASIGRGGKVRRRPLAALAARGGVMADVTVKGKERLAAIINGMLVRHAGTHAAWMNLIEKGADLIFVARGPSADERNQAVRKNVDLDAVPVARDAFVFLVNRANPVEGLTLEQVQAVYRGRVTDWKELGAPSGKIDAYQRNRNSGSQELFLERVMRSMPPAIRTRDLIANSMIGPFNAVAGRRGGIGFTVWYYERYMAVLPELKVLAVDGVRPTPETIADGSYPIVTEVIAAIRKDEPPESGARRLRDWLLTKTGQAVVAESGYVPIR
jgi:phosphate transport system substrate-binding protein